MLDTEFVLFRAAGKSQLSQNFLRTQVSSLSGTFVGIARVPYDKTSRKDLAEHNTSGKFQMLQS